MPAARGQGAKCKSQKYGCTSHVKLLLRMLSIAVGPRCRLKVVSGWPWRPAKVMYVLFVIPAISENAFEQCCELCRVLSFSYSQQSDLVGGTLASLAGAGPFEGVKLCHWVTYMSNSISEVSVSSFTTRSALRAAVHVGAHAHCPAHPYNFSRNRVKQHHMHAVTRCSDSDMVHHCWAIRHLQLHQPAFLPAGSSAGRRQWRT